MEEIHDSGRTRLIGVSNFTLNQLRLLCRKARLRPRFVQNRCYAARGWDHDVRAFCGADGLRNQGISLLATKRVALARPDLARIATRRGRTIAQAVFRFALEVGMLPLTGTTDLGHIRADLELSDFCLEPEKVESIEHLGSR